MSLYLIATKTNTEEAFTVRGPFEENDPDAVYAAFDELEKLYNLNTVMPDMYDPVTLSVVRVVYSKRYRDAT